MMTLLQKTGILVLLSCSSTALAQDRDTEQNCPNSPCALSDDDKALLRQEGYKLVAVPSDKIETYLPAQTKDPRIPKTIQGVWWVTVNPLNFILATPGGDSSWDEETRTLRVHFFGDRSVSFHYTGAAAQAYASFLRNHFTFEFKFSNDDKMATLTSAFELFGQRIELPKSILWYQMRWVEDGHFIRESWLFGQRLPDYQLRRVIAPDGTRDPAYAGYLLDADKKSYVALKDDT